MTLDRLQALLSDADTGSNTERLHTSMFLLQQTRMSAFYSFSLYHGRVRSDELETDLALLGLSRQGSAVGGGELPSEATDAAGVSLAALRVRFLELVHREPAVLEAAATQLFFRIENLGDPAIRLRWFSSLPVPVREQAADLARDLAGKDSV